MSHHPQGSTARARRYVGFTLALFVGASLGAGCSDADETEPSPTTRTCGNGTCDQATCESMLRCPDDCGVCTGADCNPTAVAGTCGEPCASSCDCISAAEMCTADFGYSSGVCVPTGCLDCVDRCVYSPDASGVCATPSCP
jgi:hypothetical protein